MHSVSFLVVNFHTSQFVVELVATIESFVRRYHYEILICDNSCDSMERSRLEGLRSSTVKLFFPSENLGFVSGNNYMFSRALFNLVVLINPDTRLIDSSIEGLFDFVNEEENVGVAGPRLINGDGSFQIGHYKFPNLIGLIKENLFLARKHPYAYKDTDTTVECDVVKGACLVMKREVAQSVNLFDSDFVMYSEEIDLCLRLRKQGLKNFFFPTACIVHFGEKSARQKQFTEYSLYHYHRSRLVYFRKHNGRAYYYLVKLILFVSLVEKTIVFFLSGKGFSARVHMSVLKRVFFASRDSTW